MQPAAPRVLEGIVKNHGAAKGQEPFPELDAKKSFVRRMFSEIVPEYDLLNRIMSFGIDGLWRKRAVKNLRNCRRVLDIGAGTGDMALALADTGFCGSVVLCDLSMEMLNAARMKVQRYLKKRPRCPAKFILVLADAEEYPFREKAFDGAMSGFVLRNLSSTSAFSRELERITALNSEIALLDVAHPENPLIARAFHFYFYRLVPFISRHFTRRKYAYRYLPASLRVFGKQREIVAVFRKNGFPASEYENIWWGMGAIYRLKR